MPIKIDDLHAAAARMAADIMHSDDDLSQKLETAVPAAAEAGPSHDELVENSHDESGISVIDGEIRPPERQNVSAVRDAIEAQAEMEIGKSIGEKEEEMEARGDGPYGDKEVKDTATTTTIDAKPGKQIIINIAGKKEQPIGGEKQHPRENTTSNGMFGGTSLSATPNFEKHSEIGGPLPYSSYIVDADGLTESATNAASPAEAMKFFSGQGINPSEVETIDKGDKTIFVWMRTASSKKAVSEYQKLVQERNQIISQNRSRQMKGLAPLPVPAKPEVPMVPVAYAADGTYEGRLQDPADCPPGCTVKWEPSKSAHTYHEIKAAFLKKGSLLTLDEVKKAGQEYLHMVRTASISVAQGQDDQGFHMLLTMNGREYVLRGQDADTFRKEYAAIPKPEAAVNKLVEKYLWKMQPYKKPTIQHPPSETKQDPNSQALRRQRSEGLADADAYWGGKEKQPNDYKRYMTQHASMMTLAKMASDYFGYDDWVTGHTALMINNDSAGLTTLHNLVRNALKKKMTPKQLAGSLAKFFKKFGDQSKKFYAENADNARGERGKHEREQLEGVVKAPSGDKARDFVDSLTNMWYDAGGQSDWEQPAGEVNWEEIASAEMESERAENPDKYPQTNKEDDEFMKGVGMKMESLKAATAVLKKVAAMSVPDKHQLRIAIDSLKMNPAMLGVMGGPSKEQALEILAKHGLRWDDEDYMAGGKGVKKADEKTAAGGCDWQTEYGMGAGDARCGAPTTGNSPWCAEHIQEAKDNYPQHTLPTKNGGEGAVKTPEEIEKEAGFNFFFPGQVLREVAPELQHELVDYPNQTNTPMQYPDITGDPEEVPEEMALAAALDGALDTTIIAYVSTSPAAAAGIGRDGKPEVLEGAPLRKENDIRGMMFTDEFYGQQSGVPGKAFASQGKAAGFTRPGSAFAYLKSLKLGKTAGADEAKQFSIFLQYVCGEIAATLVALFKVTYRPMLNQVPGKGEIQLAQVEQPQGLSSFNIYNQASRVKYLMNKLTDSEIKDAINSSSAQGAVWHEGEEGGYVYEVFVRIDDIDTESLIATYSFICGTKE